MAVDISKRIFELFSGDKRTRVIPTLAITLTVTALVAVPLVVRAANPEDGPAPTSAVAAADASIVLVDMASTDPSPLDGASVQGPVLISVEDEDATAVSFNLFASDSDEPIVSSQDLEGPRFDLLVGDSGAGQPLDTSLLPNGEYQLFLTISGANEGQRTAVGFAVANP